MYDGIASNLRFLRIALNLSQDELARRSGVSQSTISRVEAGYRRPTQETIAALAKVLQLTSEQRDLIAQMLADALPGAEEGDGRG